MTRFLQALAVLAVLMPAAAPALPLSVSKSSTVVSDKVNTLNPRVLPGSIVDYRLMVSNPLGNALTFPVTTIRQVAIRDVIAPTVKLRVIDLGAANSGPVEFRDGNLLGLGLLGSSLTYGFGGLGNLTDDVEFFDGTTWNYVPVADADGCDGKVREIRVTLRGTHASGSSFQLRYRVALL